MLILTRRESERIIIDGGIIIEIVEVNGSKVRVGITAPGRQVDREEVYIRKNNTQEKQ